MLKVTICLTNYAGVDDVVEFEVDTMVNAQRIINTYKPTPQKRSMITEWKITPTSEQVRLV